MTSANWLEGFGTTAGATHLQGDADADLDADGADFLVWQRQVSGGVGRAAGCRCARAGVDGDAGGSARLACGGAG